MGGGTGSWAKAGRRGPVLWGPVLWGTVLWGTVLWGIALCVAVLSMGCGKILEKEEPVSYDKPAVFFSTVREVRVEVAYEPAAEPYAGNGFRNGKLWEVVQANLDAAFAGRPYDVRVDVPKNIHEMRVIAPVGREYVGARDVLALAEKTRERRSTPTEAAFLVLFLDAYFAENGVMKPEVLAVSLSNKSVVAVFKRAEVVARLQSELFPALFPMPEWSVASALYRAGEAYLLWPSPAAGAVARAVPPQGAAVRSPADLTAAILEQTIVVHELGHALGLVNDGIPLRSAHHDAGHGAHCTNAKCVMYYRNEGMAALREFVRSFMSGGNLVLFGTECLGDLRAFQSDR